ncbi:MAG TPA: WecB/TagA/CpsF family glycosyltransferase [Sphingomicrobium sp.]|nr:WecB/TagA/CpsF family glycosyltransferase [Sphingomicrobium sp.]
MRTERESFLDVEFDVEPADRLVSRIGAVTAETPFQFLVTPNVDHIVRLHRRDCDLPGLEDAYGRAAYCICDSRVLALLARWRGVDLPVLPGSDLTAILLDRIIAKGDRIAVVGGDEDALQALRARYPQVEFVQHCPPMGLLRNAPARREAADFIASQKARYAFICVGSPQQELIAAEAATIPGGRGLALCVGASLDFLTGKEKRAPEIARRFGLEWAHRLLRNPKRMWRRYLVEGPEIFLLAYRWRKSAA